MKSITVFRFVYLQQSLSKSKPMRKQNLHLSENISSVEGSVVVNL
jgi:hypothetical protein